MYQVSYLLEVCNGTVSLMNNLAAQNISFKKMLHPKSTHDSEAPKPMLSNYFCTKQVISSFWKRWPIKIQIYPQTPIELTFGAFHGLVLLVKLS